MKKPPREFQDYIMHHCRGGRQKQTLFWLQEQFLMGIGPEEGAFTEWYLCAPAYHRPALNALYKAYMWWCVRVGRRRQARAGRLNLLKGRQKLAEKRRLESYEWGKLCRLSSASEERRVPPFIGEEPRND